VDLFVYGSLLFPEVMRVLLDRVPASTPAAVAGWRVAALPGRVYPALVQAEAIAKGQLVSGLTPQEWHTLDAFEDKVYELRRLTLTDGRDGWAYVCTDHTDASPDDWDMNLFERDHLVSYLKRCATWRQRREAEGSGR
jgi:gamma-glutamylcyclotransferase (GGCT)/AIG2-like uncharacterized protein YtfP